MNEKIGFWEVMMVQLAGIKVENFKAHEIAQAHMGEVKSSTEHLLMTKALWKPTIHEKFEHLQYGFAG